MFSCLLPTWMTCCKMPLNVVFPVDLWAAKNTEHRDICTCLLFWHPQCWLDHKIIGMQAHWYCLSTLDMDLAFPIQAGLATKTTRVVCWNLKVMATVMKLSSKLKLNSHAPCFHHQFECLEVYVEYVHPYDSDDLQQKPSYHKCGISLMYSLHAALVSCLCNAQ